MSKEKIRVRMPFRIDLVMGGVSDLEFWKEHQGGCLSLACSIDRKAIEMEGVPASDGFIRFEDTGGAGHYLYKVEDLLRIKIQDVKPDLKMTLAAMKTALRAAQGMGADINTGLFVRNHSLRQKGLGGSSTFAASLILLVLGVYGFPTPAVSEMVNLVNTAESLCGSNGGWEDVAGAYYPGINSVVYDPDGNPCLTVTTFPDTNDCFSYLLNNLILADTGISASTGKILSEAYKTFEKNRKLVATATKNICSECEGMLEAVQKKNMRFVGESLKRQRLEWGRITGGVSMCKPAEERINLLRPDIYGFREAGAGGGGTVLIVCRDGRKTVIERKLEDMGIVPLRWEASDYGLELYESAIGGAV